MPANSLSVPLQSLAHMNSIGCWLMRVVNHPSIITTMMVPFMFLFIEAEIYQRTYPFIITTHAQEDRSQSD
jgi:hypothetical protein